MKNTKAHLEFDTWNVTPEMRHLECDHINLQETGGLQRARVALLKVAQGANSHFWSHFTKTFINSPIFGL